MLFEILCLCKSRCFKDQAVPLTQVISFRCNITTEKVRPFVSKSRTVRELPKIWRCSCTDLHIQLYCHRGIFLCLDFNGFLADSFSHVSSQLLVTHPIFGSFRVCWRITFFLYCTCLHRTFIIGVTEQVGKYTHHRESGLFLELKTGIGASQTFDILYISSVFWKVIFWEWRVYLVNGD